MTDATAVCAGNYQQNLVTRIDPSTGAVAEQTPLAFGAHPFSVAADHGSCWAANDSGVFHGSAWSHLPASQFVGVVAAPGGAFISSADRNALLRAG